MNANVNLATSCNKTNPIQICNYHVSYAGNGNDTWYPMMRFPSGYNSTYIDYKTTTNSGANDIRYHSTYYIQQLLSPIINDVNVKYINSVNGGFTIVPNCLFRTFVKTVDADCYYSDLYIYFDNKSSTNYSIAIKNALSTFLGTTYCISSAQKNYLYANNLYASMGKTTFRTNDLITTDPDNTIQKVYDETITSANINSVLIPAYSVGYIVVKINKSTGFCSCTNPLRKSNTNSQEDRNVINTTKTNVYPNPTTGIVNFYFKGDEPKQLYISDITGKVVKTVILDKNNISIDMSSFAKEIYFYKVIYANGESENSKFIIE